MRTQVQIAQTLEDEREMNQLLLSKYQLLCLPWLYTSPNPQAQRLGEYDARHQIILCDEFRQTVMENIRPVIGDPGRYLVFPKDGLCIEWNRTSRKGRGFIPGRYYFEATREGPESSSALLKKVMSLIVRTIRRTYPKKSGKRYPIYVAPDLAKMLDKGEAELVYPDGTMMPVVNNPYSDVS
jgi:hypothetical protein